MSPDDLCRALETVPRRRLAILELAWEVVNEDGKVDQEQVIARVDQVQAAIEEARAYIRGTSDLKRRLEWLMDH